MDHIVPDLMISLRAIGLDLRVEDGKLIARPVRLISQDVRSIIELHRDDLIECLERKDPTAGYSRIDRDIRRSTMLTNSRERIVRSLERSLIRYSRTTDPLWAEVASIWAQTLKLHDAVQLAAEEVDAELDAAIQEEVA